MSEKAGGIGKRGGFWQRLSEKSELGIAVPLVLLIVTVGIVNPVFFDLDNIFNVLRQSSFTFIIGLAMTFVLVGGGLDLSVGSVLALGGVIAGLALLGGVPIWIAVLLGVLAGVVIGLFNGIVVAVFKIPSLIVTLGMMYFARGVVQVLTRGNPGVPAAGEPSTSWARVSWRGCPWWSSWPRSWASSPTWCSPRPPTAGPCSPWAATGRPRVCRASTCSGSPSGST